MKPVVSGTLALVASCGTATALPPTFTGLGFIPGSTHSEAYGLSADGSLAVGYCDTGGGTSQAFRWSGGVMTGLGDLPGGIVASAAFCTSANGDVIGGQGTGLNGREAFRYDGAFTALGGAVFGGHIGSQVNASSANGAVLAGSRELPGGYQIACRWNGTTLSNIGILVSGGIFSYALGVSGDGSVIVGGSDSAKGFEAYRWTLAGGMVGLGDLHPGDNFSSLAFGISRDATAIVGWGTTELSETHAFRWTTATGMTDLGALPDSAGFAGAYAVNADGRVVVGVSTDASGTDEAFVWDDVRGMRPLREVLAALGVDVTGWELSAATAISDDGLTVAGYGVNPSGQTEAWIATLPCPADHNADGFVTGEDFDFFVWAFVAGDQAADFNSNSYVNGDDFDAFVVAFAAGC